MDRISQYSGCPSRICIYIILLRKALSDGSASKIVTGQKIVCFQQELNYQVLVFPKFRNKRFFYPHIDDSPFKAKNQLLLPELEIMSKAFFKDLHEK
jgi:hypothetical protein